MANYLYIHIPFCLEKCIYCDFYSVSFKSQIVRDYINALCQEIKLRTPNSELRAIYIGGGTPTILPEKEIEGLLHAIRDNYSINSDAEITIEANPGTITAKKAESLLKSGINRISIGVQSFNDTELSVLGRSHDASDALEAVESVKKAGFNNISIDLIYGIPKQSLKDWEYSLRKAVEISPEHISTYELTPEKNTPLYEDIKFARIVMPEEELISDMYYRAIDVLNDHGYIHYEISNFAKPGFECRHNLNYWDRGEYLGIGAGAHSFFNSRRTGNIRNVSGYIESLNQGVLPVNEEVEIKDDDALKEYIFLGIRKTDGIDISLLSGKGPQIQKVVDELVSHDLVELKGNRLKLTRKGLILSNEVIVQVLLCIDKSLPA